MNNSTTDFDRWNADAVQLRERVHQLETAIADDREMRLGILNAFQAFMRDAQQVEAFAEPLARSTLAKARKTAEAALTAVLLAHPANKPATAKR